MTRASHSGSTMVVALRSAMIAGPAMRVPGRELLARDTPACRGGCRRVVIATDRERPWASRRDTALRGMKPRPGIGRADGLHRHRLDDERAVGHEEAEAIAVEALEVVAHLRRSTPSGTASEVSVPSYLRCTRFSRRSNADALLGELVHALLAQLHALLLDVGDARRPRGAARPPPRAARAPGRGPCRRRRARPRADGCRRASCRARRRRGRRAGRPRRRSRRACIRSRRGRAAPR